MNKLRAVEVIKQMATDLQIPFDSETGEALFEAIKCLEKMHDVQNILRHGRCIIDSRRAISALYNCIWGIQGIR